MAMTSSWSRDRIQPMWWGDLLRCYPSLGALSPALQRQVTEHGRTVRAPSGHVAFEEDAACTGLTLLTAGAIHVVRGSPQGREILLYRVRPGESCILSVCCLLGRSAYTARGVVAEDVTGVNLPGGLFEQLVAEAPAFRMFIFELFGARVAALLQLVEELAFHRLEARIAAMLLREFAGAGTTELHLTHQELADQVGSAREIVSRTLAALQKRGAVSLGRGRLTLVDPATLAAAAGELNAAVSEAGE